MPVLLIL